MQTGSAASPEDSGDPESRWQWRLGHAGPWLLSACWAILAVSMVLDIGIVGVPVTALLVVTFILGIHHDFQPVCIRCLREQPEDGGVQAQRRLRTLWMYHLPPIGPMGGMFVSLTLSVAWVAGAFLRETPLGAPLTLVGGLLIAYEWYVAYRHRQLKPWCPWCKDPGDDPDPVPERDPDPSMTKQG